MSGFEMHRFRAIDNPLSKAEQEEIDSWSSRFSSTSVGVTYIYHYGSFKKDPHKIFHKYFDAMLYVDSWGTKQLMFRFPKNRVVYKDLLQYEVRQGENHQTFTRKGDYIVMELYWNEEEGGGWMEEEDYLLDSLIGLRAEILKGNFGALYMGWQMVMEKSALFDDEDEDDYDDDDDYDDECPPIPANLQRRTGAQTELIRVFEIDKELVAAASSISPNQRQEQLDYVALIKKLSNKEKEDFLLQIAKGGQHIDLALQKRLRELSGVDKNTKQGKVLSWHELNSLKK